MNRFAATAEAIAATTSKLEKRRLLADYLRSLDESNLYWAVTFFSGLTFPRASGRVVQLGFAALRAAAATALGLPDGSAFDRAYLTHSDVGDSLAQLFADQPATKALTLADLAACFEVIEKTRGARAKEGLAAQLLYGLGPLTAKYVAKILTGDLRIGLKEGLVEEAVAQTFEQPVAAIRRAHLLNGDLAQVAVAAKHGRLEEVRMTLFQPLKSMLATAEASPEAIIARLGAELWVEDKLDGIRAHAHKQGERVELYSRDLKPVTGQFPEVGESLARIPGDFVLDGEVLAARGGLALPFFELQKRLGRKELTPAVLAEVPVVYVAFDCLYRDGEALLDAPLRVRRAALEALPLGVGTQRSLLRRVEGAEAIEREFAAARSRANEGLMIKDPDSFYTPGRRGISWLKYKKALEPLDVVVTGVEFGHGRRREVLSDYTFAVRDPTTGELLNVGKAFTGLTDAEILQFTDHFKATTLQDFGRFRLVRPEVVLEVAFEAIQRSPRHKSGFALRFPRILRVRTDKGIDEINTIDDVRRLYEQYYASYAASGRVDERADDFMG
jgi:DNA ligase-1